MTALLSRDATNFAVACDGCGQLVPELADLMHHWDLAWGLLRQHGWTGAALATGPHTCPRCGKASPPAGVIDHMPNRVAAPSAGRRLNRLMITELPVATVVEVRGALTGVVGADLYGLLLAEWPARQHIVVDLSAAGMPDSDVLDVLVRAQARAAQYAFEVCLVGLSDVARAALRLLCLDRIWSIFTDCAEALAWLSGPAPDYPAGPVRAGPAQLVTGVA